MRKDHRNPGLKLYLILALAGVAQLARADDWPQWLGPNRDSIWREEGIVDRFFLFSEVGDLILAKLSPARYEEISRAHLLEPTNEVFEAGSVC